MRSIGLATGFDIWTRSSWGHRLGLAILVMAWPLILLILAHTEHTDIANDSNFLRNTVLPMLVGWEMTFGLLITGNLLSQVKGKRVGFPSWNYVRPVSTRALVFWHMFWGVLTMVALHLCATSALALTIGHWPPLIRPALFLAVGFAGCMTAIWSLPDFGFLRVVGVGLLLSVLLFGSAVRSTAPPAITSFWRVLGLRGFWDAPTLRGIAGLCLLLVMAWTVAVAGVARDRRGDAQGFPKLDELLWRRLDRQGYRERRWRSSEAAQFWFEWRGKGWFLPAGMIIAQIAIVSVCAGRREFQGMLWVIIGLSMYGPPVGAFAVGGLIGRSSDTTRHPELDLFRATRPLADRALAGTNLKVGAVSILAAWGIGLAGVLLTILSLSVCGQGAVVRQVWHDWIWEFGFTRSGYASFGLLALCSLLASWILISLMATFVMAGHGKVMTGGALALIALFLAGILHLDRHGISAQWWPTISQSILIVLGGASLVGTAVAIGISCARGLIPARYFIVSAACWVLFLMLGLGCGVAYRHYLPLNVRCFGLGFLSLAAATPALATLAMAWNRHR